MRKQTTRRLLLAAIALTAVIMGISGIKGQRSAMPRTDLRQTEARLKEAVEAGKGEESVSLLMQIWELEGSLDRQKLPAVIDRIAQTRSRISDPVGRSLLYTLEFTALGQYYSDDSWRIDQREDVEGMTGDDISLWSRAQFRRRIEALADSALTARDALLSRRSSDYKDILTFNDLSALYYPTLYDAVANQAVTTLKMFAERGGVLNARLTGTPMDFTLYPDPARSIYGRILSVYRSMAAGREGGSAPAVAAEANMLGFICDNVFSEDGPDRYEAYTDAFRRVSQSEYAPLFLTRLSAGGLSRGQRKELYALLTDALEAHPSMPEANEVKNMLAQLSARKVGYSAPRQVGKGKEFAVTVDMSNCTSARLALVEITGVKGLRVNDDYYSPRRMGAGRTVASLDVTCEGEIPFAASKTVRFTAPSYGLYTVIPGGVEGLREDISYPVIRCSDLSGGSYGQGKSQTVVAVDAMTGAPAEGVAAIFSPWRNNAAPAQKGALTSADGFTRITSGESGTLSLRKGSDRYGSSFSYYGGEREAPGVQTRGQVFTALALYRPGDEVKFSFVAFSGKDGDFRPAAGKEFTLELMRNYSEKKDSRTLTSDEWGRGEGTFTLPVGEPGDYNISLRYGDSQIGSCRFTVSDYRLPTFEVKVADVERPSRPGESATIKGRAMTFAGFPVEGAQVRVQLKVRSGFWLWSRTSATFYEAEATTGADGAFTVVIPGEVMAYSPDPDGYFSADVAVTSPDGETHNAACGYNLGKPMTISASIPRVFVPGEGKASVRVLDYSGKTADMALDYIVSKVTRQLFSGEDAADEVYYGEVEAEDQMENAAAVKTEVVKRGTLKGADFGTVLSELPSGCYTVEFSTSDSALAEPVESGEVVVYRKDDSSCPVNSMLWLPQEDDITAGADGVAEIVYGTALDSPRVLMTVSDALGNPVEQRWLDARKGMNRQKVTLPKGSKTMRVRLDVVQRMHRSSANVGVMAASTRAAITLKTETFRDKVIPGSAERITFRVTGTGGADPRSAVMLDMSNKAIDVLAPNPMSLWVPGASAIWMNCNLAGFGDVRAQAGVPVKRLSTEDPVIPVLALSGMSVRYSLYNTSLRIRGAKMMMSADEAAVEESADEAPMMAAGAPAMKEMKSELSENAVVTEADGGSSASSPEEAAETYRPSEIPLAFFRPCLTTDAEGNLEISYDVPDANTTWQLRALAYNSLMLTAADAVEIQASKPLMVSANGTRFLRGGDSAVFKASVMNATDSTVMALTVTEILDAATGTLLTRAEQTDTIAPMGRAVAAVDVRADGAVSGLIYRVRSTAGDYTDGEQTLIPVLPSEQNVTEAINFYLAPSEAHFSTRIPAVGDGRAYLKFTENPAWEVVSALPGLREQKINSSLEGAAMVFSGAVAEGLTRSNPDIVKALRRWSENPEDSALVSKLEKDQVLKSILLSATPWVSDALTQTQRMQRLVLLLDPANARRTVKAGIDLLAKHVAPEGGWYWTTTYPEVSQWCTTQILDILGGLERLGWTPDDKRLKDMTADALRYLDRETAAEFARYPKGDYSLYCYTRSKFSAPAPSTAARRVISATVQRMVGEWRDHDVARKAVDALVLAANGYSATSGRILASLREYASQSPEKGMWWPQLEGQWFMSFPQMALTSVVLDAFHTVEPRCADVEKIRQWLILNKVNNEWGASIATTQVIASILTSGSLTLSEKSGTAIRVNDTLIEPQRAEYATGAFTEQITGMTRRGAVLTIDRQGDYPSVGGVVMMRVLPMADVKAVTGGGIAVEKSLSVFSGGQWIPSGSFKVGDRVKVTLTLKVSDAVSYVVIQDLRPAGMEPVSQLPTPVWADGLCFYRENGDSQTNLFIRDLPRGNYVLEYDLFATQGGTYSSGVAQVQSLYNPTVAAHSAGMTVTVE